MKHILTLMFLTAFLSISLYAAKDTVDVPTDNPTIGGNLNNAIQTAINAGTFGNTVFRLEAGGFYILTGIVTTPAHEQLTLIGPDPGTTQATALPQIALDVSGGITWTQNFDCYGDVYMKNIWLLYAGVDGTQQGISLTIEDDSLANLSGKGEIGTFDNVIFDYSKIGYSGSGAVGLYCRDFKGSFRNCYFRNCSDPHFQYYGRAVSWTYGSTQWHTDTLSFVNCTFANMGYTLMMEAPEIHDHVWFNHCTFNDVTKFPLENGYWHWLAVTNCIFVNTYMYGDVIQDRDGTYHQTIPNGGTINIDTLAGLHRYDTLFTFTAADRHILFANSSYGVSQWLKDLYQSNVYVDTTKDTTKLPRVQPMMSAKTLTFFNDKGMWPYISKADLYDNTVPDFKDPLVNLDSTKAFLVNMWLKVYSKGYRNVNWADNPDNDVNGIWPLSEDFSYTNGTLLTAGLGGFPLGDLYHWFPAQYTQWKAQEAAENTRINTWLATGTDPGTVGVNEQQAIPYVYKLEQNYPNPFNPTTTIKFTLAKSSDVNLVVYNILGKVVATLVNGNLAAGNHTVNFNAANLSSGIYFYKLQAGDFVSVKKLMLLK
jgi:hypothetical protein